MDKSIILIGFMGAGKSSVAKKLSFLLKKECFEADYEIVKKADMSIPEIFEKYGEKHFRDLETEVMRDICGKSCIVSCGGGVVLRDENIEIIKENGIAIFLTATPETVFNRVKNHTNRPLLDGKNNVEYIESMMNQRRERYLLAADIVVETDNRDISDIAGEIIEKINNL